MILILIILAAGAFIFVNKLSLDAKSVIKFLFKGSVLISDEISR